MFESLTDGWDKDYKDDEIPPYLKEIRMAVIANVDSGINFSWLFNKKNKR